MKNYNTINKTTWNSKVKVHVESEFYNNEAFLAGHNTIPYTDLNALGDVKGKRVLHLQCHFGQDTLSLARMGAQVTGIDFSEKAIEVAINMNMQLGLNAEFICCDVYETLKHIKEPFDIVYTSYGVIGWLPDLDQWARVIAHALRPGGKLVFFEFHPVVWMFDNDFTHVQYNYFKDEPIKEDESGTYADRYVEIEYSTITWNHSLSEVIQALLKNDLQLVEFEEYDFSHYACFNNNIEFEPNKYRITSLKNKIPMMYGLICKKNKMKSIFNTKDNQEMIARIQKLAPNTPALWGKMSVDQMLQHCNDAVLVAFNEKELHVPLLFRLLGKLMKNWVLKQPEFDKNSPTAKEFKYYTNFDFEKVQQELINNVSRFAAGEHAVKCINHPFWGKMSAADWNNLQWKHLDHHLRQFGV